MSGFFPLNSALPIMLRTQQTPAAGVRGAINGGWFTPYSRQLLPDDPLGSVVITLTGTKAGSEIKIFDKNKVLLGGTESSSGDLITTLSRYSENRPINTVRILVISLGYEVIDITYALPKTATSVPIFQRIDRNYRNPT